MLKEIGGITYAASPLLEPFDFIIHGFLSRIGGVSKAPFYSLNFDTRDGDDSENIEQNKAIAGKLFGFDKERLLTIKQVHGNDVLIIDKPVKNIAELSQMPADAIVTNQCNIAVAILTADCVPIVLVDPVLKVIGIVHAGWRGTAKGVVQKAIEAMTLQFGSQKKNLIAAVGPSIGQCCYKVDEAVAKEFGWEKAKHCSDDFIQKSGDNWRLDLKKANTAQMLQSGILEKNISVENLCTSCRNDLFFSYRKDNKKTGRQLNFIVLK